MNNTLLRTKASPKWLGKQVLFTLVVFGFAIWAFVDASIIYPRNGLQAADFLKLQYLKESLAPGVLEKVSVENPAEELSELESRESGAISKQQRARLEWLIALRNAHRLEPSYTQISDPRAEQKALDERFAKAEKPKALSKLDIPVQWMICGVCGAAGILMLFVLLRTTSTGYTYDPATNTLGLPGGASLTPADIELFDKRKWDKFLIFLKIRQGQHPMAGREIKLDLLRFVPLEDWILEMEKIAFPPADAPAGAASPSAMLMTQPDVELPKA
ncbi:MAG: hypothetical protein U0573_02395 [Phycisphaerales bacterium]|nr:hypothetical protein [Planctomycetota bacterium]